MIISILGIIDIVVGIILVVGGLPIFQNHGLVITLAILMLIKGGWTWISNIADPNGLNFDPMGILDIITGLLLVSIYSGFFLFFFAYIGVILIIKGIYSFVVGVVK
jgi:hypothetical protein